jgi:hypothetical protein
MKVEANSTLDPPGFGREITVAEARKTYGRNIVAATLAHMHAEDWPEANSISRHFFENMKRAIAAYRGEA